VWGRVGVGFFFLRGRVGVGGSFELGLGPRGSVLRLGPTILNSPTG
jgi:hypothetical protein